MPSASGRPARSRAPYGATVLYDVREGPNTMPLDEYRAKRDFDKTPEPAGGEPSDAGLLYVIQEHAATAHHYDFRLELDGVLLSWAIPKGPSCVPADKRLAMRTEDHPLDYASFEGVIPEHEYGGGTVIVWDRGTWHPHGAFIDDPKGALAKGELKIVIEGEKLHGKWALIRLKPRGNEKRESWLLIKDRDEFACTSADEPIEVAEPRSVISGRTIQEVAAEEGGGGRMPAGSDPAPRADQRTPAVAPPAETAAGQAETELLGSRGAVEASMPSPADVSLELARLVSEPPADGAWLSEVKYDGYRALLFVDGGRVRAITRGGHDWSERFEQVVRAAEHLPVESAVLDGEVVVFDDAGVSRFQLLQDALTSHPDRIAYVAFDLLYLNGYDLRGTPLTSRKELLQAVLAGEPPTGTLRLAEHIDGGQGRFYAQACTLGLEGIVLKKPDSAYHGARSGAWLKVKCVLEQEFVIAGWTDPKGARDGFGALLLGYYDGDTLVSAGKVGSGFSEASIASISRKLAPLARKTSPFASPPREKTAHWVTPKLVAEVAFTEWTAEGSLRHPTFLGLREDVSAKDVTREKAAEPDQPTPDPKDCCDVAGVSISSPEKRLLPESPITKLDLARYYERVAPLMLAQIAERPLTLLRCPGGGGTGCFWQRHPDRGSSGAIKTFLMTWPGDEDAQEWLYVDDAPGIVTLAQLGVAEIHVWNSRYDLVNQPDRIVFDLDPGPGVTWPQIAASARQVRDMLAKLKLDAFVKTTGGKGLHVVAPIEPSFDYQKIRAFSKSVVDALVAESPDRFVGRMAKAERGGKVFVDYLRNALGSSAVAAYSTRSRPGAPVSVPIAWDELTDDLDPATFDVPAVLARIERLAEDPWARMDERQASSRTLRAAFSAIS